MILQVSQLQKAYQSSAFTKPIQVLKGIDFQVQKSETVAITGQSGSGKSTLLALLAGLDSPTSGDILLADNNIVTMSEAELAKFRASEIGIVFQQFYLMPHLTAKENVRLSLDILKNPEAEERAIKALEQVGLQERVDHFPNQMSGGECQRVAIARALVGNPSILLADEPTGNLDQQTGEQISRLLFDLVEKNQMTLIIVTHNQELANQCKRKLILKQGKLQ
ncbi:MAG: putative ABC transport system ATP-binding protein [bacterium]|jgi:putative ABC transport system ATP-binding protein